MTMLCGVSCHHLCRQLRERDGVPSSVSSSVVTSCGGRRREWKMN